MARSIDIGEGYFSRRMTGFRCRACLLFLLTVVPIAKAQTPDQIVKWKAGFDSQAPLKPGQKVTARLKATIKDGWHVYSISQVPGGPSPTVIGVPEGQSLSQAGTILGPLPHSGYDQNFDLKTEFYERSAEFNVPLLVTANPGAGRIVIAVRFQTCNERICLPPKTTEVPLTFRVTRP